MDEQQVAPEEQAMDGGPASGRRRRGFAAMDREQQRTIARKGGKTAHELGLAHEFTPEEAQQAGRKGGLAVSQNRAHMAEIGRKGGKSRGQRRDEGGSPAA